MSEELTLWEPPDLEVIPANATSLPAITGCAVQLTERAQEQISSALERGDYEVGINYLWQKAMAALKRDLGSLGAEFVGEMLGRTDIDDDDDVRDILTEKEALRLAEELGMVSSIEGMRLRHTQELVSHFASRTFSDETEESAEMEQAEALSALRACVKNILGKPHIQVAKRFVEFRESLLDRPLAPDDPTLALLGASPYFFRKLSLSILLSTIKAATSASLEIALGNLNLILPALWPSVRDTEKWQVGHTYAEVYAAGKSVATKGVKQALLKVRGFDFVPENLRSGTFVKAAEAIISAHEGMNNFYLEKAPVNALEKLGTVIPAPAIAACTSALLSVAIGNSYGVSFEARPIAESMLKKYTSDRWEYYFNQCLPGDIRILDKLVDPGPQRRWFSFLREIGAGQLSLTNPNLVDLIDGSLEGNETKVSRAHRKLLASYYGSRSQ